MRLDFNIILIDDDKDDVKRQAGVMKLKQQVENHIRKKGFNPKITFVKSSTEVKNFPASDKARVDLYLSDNNLSNSSHHGSKGEKDGGIELYLELRKSFLCDFILYSRVNKLSIVKKIVDDLNMHGDPNIFTRFSFIERKNNDDLDEDTEEWFIPILNIIDHIISKREELNNLRGIFAQVMSRVHHKLIERYNYSDSLTLDDVLKRAGPTGECRLMESKYIELMDLKGIRNGLLHNDEEICYSSQRRFIRYKKFSRSAATNKLCESKAVIYEDDDFNALRKRLYAMFQDYK